MIWENTKMESKFGLQLFLVLLICWEIHAAVNCTATGAGRFANPDDTTCQNYTLCVYVSTNKTYVSYNYVCSGSTVFNPATSQCTASSNYVCNVTKTNSTTSVCTAEGFFADPSSTNCSSYIQCVNVNGTYDETTYTCPDITFYNPETTLCEFDYTCPSKNATFACSAAGRFANSTDTACKTYYFCVLNTNGRYLQYSYTCPSSSVFDPYAKVCTTSYSCVISIVPATVGK